jgi:hypothetical protein
LDYGWNWLEGLIGYLYLNNQEERLLQLMQIMVEEKTMSRPNNPDHGFGHEGDRKRRRVETTTDHRRMPGPRDAGPASTRKTGRVSAQTLCGGDRPSYGDRATRVTAELRRPCHG